MSLIKTSKGNLSPMEPSMFNDSPKFIQHPNKTCQQSIGLDSTSSTQPGFLIVRITYGSKCQNFLLTSVHLVNMLVLFKIKNRVLQSHPKVLVNLSTTPIYRETTQFPLGHRPYGSTSIGLGQARRYDELPPKLSSYSFHIHCMND